MALEASMPREQIEAVLRRDPLAMNSATIPGFRFADAVVRRSGGADEFRDAIRAQRGEIRRDRFDPGASNGPNVPDGESGAWLRQGVPAGYCGRTQCRRHQIGRITAIRL